jgi:hypothetical protein
MQVGDLVKMKWVTFASKRRAKAYGRPVDEPGFIVELSGIACKVVFPSQGNKICTFTIDTLELVSGSS